MPRNVITIESYQAASSVWGQQIAPRIEQVLTSLQQGLVDSGAMAGSDPAGVSWASSYDPTARSAFNAIQDLGTASFSVAGLLEQTGFNHAAGERASTAGGGGGEVDRTKYMTMTVSALAAPPTASGGSSSPPSGWGIVQHAVGYAWPNGHQDKLRASALAWQEASLGMLVLTSFSDGARTSISNQISPDVDAAMATCTNMNKHFTDLSNLCQDLADGCEQLASHIDSVHSAVESEIASFIAWSADIQVAGGVLGAITLGAAEVPAQAAEAERIVATGARIARLIEMFIAAAKTVAEVFKGVISRIVETASKLKPLLAAREGTAAVTAARALPVVAKDSEAVVDAELIGAAEEDAATGGLTRNAFAENSPWTLKWSKRGLEIEAQLGGNLPRSFPTIDKFEKGLATSIKSMDLNAKTYADAAKLRSRLGSYIKKVADFKGARWDGREIKPEMITGRELEVAVPTGAMTGAQRAVFAEMKALAEKQGVKFTVTEVP